MDIEETIHCSGIAKQDVVKVNRNDEINDSAFDNSHTFLEPCHGDISQELIVAFIKLDAIIDPHTVPWLEIDES